ncbi:signal recognition particle protein [Porcincola intestinalis]|uniref:signal recognition particle protein n=1 Tax=Porcincola intestinalis TaxID=2606632 RepID=UPI0023F57010|nr:signal recognition particle protein [Porcincola intestinalis]MCI6768510.1 signal recognition particle protein [Lachnospiraceae bacterium]MCI7093085.1 signal recognition particle protein [Lachnospiraceae bacterium]MDD7060046.1 signal recognition particle protein [Porcincola intestinalis]MDY4205000.1 signal recognition particle protein [Porcincola intestinalis]MDY5282725.1 signal recognition particle protein [Porcincola intestinalis]
MAFESLSDKLQNIFKNLRKKGKLTEEDVKSALKEVKLALLEADVSFKVVKSFMKDVQDRAVGADVMNGLNPGQMVIKIVSDELTSLMGSEMVDLKLNPQTSMTVIMMMGLNGAGKTTTSAKLAAKLKSRGYRPLLAGLDIYRPAAVKQLQVNAEKIGIDVYWDDKHEFLPPDIAKNAVGYAQQNGYNIVILDTAGRLQIDKDMMDELHEIKEKVTVDDSILVVDAMTGQDAVNVASAFEEKVGIDGVILTKLDGDTRGGAALSIRATVGKPILYVGMGEKLDDLQQFYPDRMASRILGMGDVMTLIEKAQQNVNEEQARAMEQKLRKASFGFDDYLASMDQMKKMGGMKSVLSMIPGVSTSQMSQFEDAIDEKAMARTEAIIYSMTPKERSNPDILTPSRRARVAKGAGVSIDEVNRLCRQFEQSRKLMKQYGSMLKGGKKRRGFGGMGGLGGMRLPF